MAVTTTQIATMRRLVNEPTEAIYTDSLLTEAIEARSITDSRGVEPLVWDYSVTPPIQIANINWSPTYDMNAAAADIWEEKSAVVASDFEFTADGSTFLRNQVYEQYLKLAGRFRSRARIGGVKLVATQRERDSLTGAVVESVPIIDRMNYEVAFNSGNTQ